MKQQKEQMKKTLGGSDSDGGDSDFDDDSEEEKPKAKVGAKPAAAKK